MSDQEMKNEAIRLINEIDADRMEDLLACLRVFREQQDYASSYSNSPEVIEQLNRSLREAKTGPFYTTEEVFSEVRRDLRDRMDRFGNIRLQSEF
ncbi:hypothetical protein [Dyadobacter soli]|nr:hypothetical protein [Dyadobacter soli]